jgi:hypothetical protein
MQALARISEWLAFFNGKNVDKKPNKNTIK